MGEKNVVDNIIEPLHKWGQMIEYYFLDNNGCLDKSCYRCVDDWYRVVIRRQYHCRKKCPVGHFGFLTAQKTKLCFSKCSINRKCL